MNAKLIVNHFEISQQKSSNLSSAKSITFSDDDLSIELFKMIQAFYMISKHLQICLNYNKDRCTNPCAIDHRHVCAICAKDHVASHCSLAKQSAS